MKLAILTSGGDAPGMNPALRAVARSAHAAGVEIVAVSEGFDGLINGWVRPLSPTDVSGLLSRGGTVLGTARSDGFRSKEGRRAAVRTLVDAQVDGLVVIGGDGSLTGASTLASEWSTHLADLVSDGSISADRAAAHPALRVVGLVGSIDNDFWGTDATIGGDSALHRVVDAIDALTSTAASHQRSFVVEVMGRHCGWLALTAAICTGADAVLLPEAPPEDWRAYLLGALASGREAGRRHAVVVVAEGARDRQGTPISAAEVQDVLRDGLGQDTRVTVLGHVQRGGVPSAYDRVMTTILGARAVQVLRDEPDAPRVLGTAGPRILDHDLDHAVAKSREASDAASEGNHRLARDLRGPGFAALLELRHTLARPRAAAPSDAPAVLIVHVGAPAPGMNAAVTSVARGAIARGWRALGAHEGLRGAVAGELQPLDWMAVDGWISQGGANLGTNRDLVPAEDLRPTLELHGIGAIAILGGFEALEAADALRSLDLPIAVVPATISSNVPGTWRSIGSDTACNAIIEAVDRLRQSAVGARDRVFVVEVMGRRCGALAATAALGSGAELVLTHEDGVDLTTVQLASAALNASFDRGRKVGLALVSDGVDAPFDARSLTRILSAEAGDRFDTRLCVLGHLQQGGRPSPADRIDGARLGAAAIAHCTDGRGAVVVGLHESEVRATILDEVLAMADRTLRRARTPDHAGVLHLARALGVPPAPTP